MNEGEMRAVYRALWMVMCWMMGIGFTGTVVIMVFRTAAKFV